MPDARHAAQHPAAGLTPLLQRCPVYIMVPDMIATGHGTENELEVKVTMGVRDLVHQ